MLINAKWESICKSPFTHGNWERGYLWVNEFFSSDPKPKFLSQTSKRILQIKPNTIDINYLAGLITIFYD